VCVTIGPAFLSASIYLTLSRIISVYSSSISRFKPRTYTVLFITFDFIALLLQSIGGAIASLATDAKTDKLGINLMVAGVSWQVFSLGLFGIICAEFAWRVKKAWDEDLTTEVEFVQLRRTLKFKLFLFAVTGATLAVFVRSVFRCAELRSGFKGKLANQEITFMVLEGAMIISAVALLTIWHPGLVFREKWEAAAWSLRTKKVEVDEKVGESGEKRKLSRWSLSGKEKGGPKETVQKAPEAPSSGGVHKYSV
jgi:RTA1 like protein